MSYYLKIQREDSYKEDALKWDRFQKTFFWGVDKDVYQQMFSNNDDPDDTNNQEEDETEYSLHDIDKFMSEAQGLHQITAADIIKSSGVKPSDEDNGTWV